nr:helix-turn-helix transcriptional regulator [Lacunisphaera limnophila]
MISLKTEADLLREAADSLRTQRMALGLRQGDLATRSGVSIATLRRFERTGQIGFLGFAKLLVSLGLADRFLSTPKPQGTAPSSIEAFLASSKTRPPRQRVRVAGVA